jgi:hypothetical protein
VKEMEIQSAFVHDPSYSVKVRKEACEMARRMFSGSNPAGAVTKRKNYCIPMRPIKKYPSSKMPTMLFPTKHPVCFVCVSHNMLLPMQKRPREYAASLQMQNSGSTTAANGDIKITVVES